MSEMVERVALAISGSDDPENILSIHRYRARAAIEAMREPTEAMTHCISINLSNYQENAIVWESMIDAALK